MQFGKAFEQYQKALKNEKPNGTLLGICIGVSKKTMRYSCIHRIADLKKFNFSLKPLDLHSHWLHSKRNMPQPSAGEKTGEEIFAAIDIQ